jgi:hypothetical protein
MDTPACAYTRDTRSFFPKSRNRKHFTIKERNFFGIELA